jgi:hypothetical protein
VRGEDVQVAAMLAYLNIYIGCLALFLELSVRAPVWQD